MVRKFALVISEDDIKSNKKTFWSMISSSQIVGIDDHTLEKEAKEKCNQAQWGKDKKWLACIIQHFDGKYNF